MRILIFAILAYLFYRIVKGIFGATKEIKGRKDGPVIDEMVQDPFCKTYIPRRESVRRVIRGEEYFFCSENCADKYESD